jgi:hypothetical protein
MAKRPRDVIREARFDREAAAIDQDVRRMDEALRYVEMVVTVDPEFGIKADERGVWLAPIMFGDTSSGIQGATIFYAFDDVNVYLLSMRADW